MQILGARKLPPMSDSTLNVYVISVAAEMVGTGVQNLRAYERAGLVTPGRTAGGTRMYSGDDITRLRRVAALLEAGLNLAGIAMVLELEEENDPPAHPALQQQS